MSSVAALAQHDARAARIKRKPPPATASHQTPIQQQQQQQQHQQQPPPPLHKLSFSERYPDPDPADPFAPLWVLRNRTSSALHREPPPLIPLLQRESSVQDDPASQCDRRRSVSYLHTLTHHVPDTQPFASDHGHPAPARVQPTYSTDVPSSTRRQSFKPSHLSHVTPLAVSASRSSVDPQPIHVRLAHPSYPENDSSGAESDTTRVHQSGSEIDSAPLSAAQRSRVGSSNKLTRFLKTRNTSIVRGSITDVERVRKASISPPVFSTVVWASQGQDFVSIKNHPLRENAISILANATVPDVVPPRSDTLGTLHTRKTLLPIASPVPIRNTPSPGPIIPSSQPATTHDDLTDSTTLPAPPRAPALTSHVSQTSHTDETHSTFSFVHVHTPQPNPPPSPPRTTPEFTRRSRSTRPFTTPIATAPAAALLPASASMPTPFPSVAATITSSATTKIKRTTSRSTSKPTGNLPSSEPKGEWDIPSLADLAKAASLPIIAESGVRVNFGALFAQQRVIVIFVRHFWCPLCQDYMSSVASLTRHVPEILAGDVLSDGETEKAGSVAGVGSPGGQTKLVVISNGSYTMIGKYKQIFGLGFDVYTDPSLAIYATLGMGKDPGSLPQQAHAHEHGKSRNGQAHLHARDLGASGKYDLGRDSNGKSSSGCGNGGYVKHGLMGGIAMVFVRALKVGMPVWEKGGDLHQLGGEFVFGPGMACTYAHRMQTAKGHAPFDDVLRAAGALPSVTQPPQRHFPKESENNDIREKEQNRKSTMSSLKTRKHLTRTRGQTIDVVPTTENKRSHRRRRSVARATSMGAGGNTSTSVNINARIIPSPLVISPERAKRSLESSVVVSAPASMTTIPCTGASTNGTLPRKLLDGTAASATTKSDEERWVEERHRGLQRLKEKKNVRRGLANEYREQELNRRLAGERSTSGSRTGGGEHDGHAVSVRAGSMQRQTSVKRDDDDIVLFGREMRMNRVNLSRSHVTWTERERERHREDPKLWPIESARTVQDVGGDAQVEDDVESSSDKTLVHPSR